MPENIIINTNSAQVISELDAVKAKDNEVSAAYIENTALKLSANEALAQSISGLTLFYSNLAASINTSTTSLANYSVMAMNASAQNAMLSNTIMQMNQTMQQNIANWNTMNESMALNSVILLLNTLVAFLANTQFSELSKSIAAINESYEKINSALLTNTLLLGLNALVLLLHKITLDSENKALTSNTTRRTNNNKRTAAGIGLKGFELGLMAGFPAGLVLGPAMGAAFTVAAFAIVQKGISALAKGGVVSAPTMALVGEGRYNEAVVPLGSSPQFAEMKQDIATAVVRGISQLGLNSANNRPIEVVVNLDSREIARATEKGKRLNSAYKTAVTGGVL